MKILYVTTISNTVNAFLVPHIKMLIEEGHQVDVACNIVQEVDPQLEELGCKVHQVPFQRKPISKMNFLSYKILKSIINTGNYDLVHTHTPNASVITRLVCKGLDSVKVIYTAHGFHFFKGAPIKNWLIYYPIEKWLSRYTDMLITINKEDFEVSKKHFSANRIKYVPGVGINTQRFKPVTKEEKELLRAQFRFSSTELIIIYVGELSYRKNQNLLIDAVDQLKDKEKLRVLLVGTGSCENELKNKVNEKKLGEIFEFLGFRKDVDKLMALSDIVISTSRQEGLPVNILEGMASLLPLIVSNCRGNRDLVEHKRNGLVVDINDAKGFSEAIELLRNNPDFRSELARNNENMIVNYDVKKIEMVMKDIYNSLLIK